MSQLHLYRPDSSDEPRILSFAFYAPLIRAERAMKALRQAREKASLAASVGVNRLKPAPTLKLYRNPWDR
jgi:hypothetical protein